MFYFRNTGDEVEVIEVLRYKLFGSVRGYGLDVERFIDSSGCYFSAIINFF